ncbi:MAG: DUF2892 domain-containing protein [Candidatus Krumholzibacteria bacterium]|nr:DUF2892 domain-containing protein [Candidatus Krumholzibacteria bacterium]
MKKTVGPTDKIIRIILGIILLILAFATSVGPAGKAILIILAIVALLTAMTGICPLYSLFGMSTCKVKNKDS